MNRKPAILDRLVLPRKRNSFSLKPRALLLDAAGTLIHPAEPVGTVYARAAAAFGAGLDPAATDRAFREVFRATPPPPARAHPGVDDEKDWWRRLVGRVFDRFEPSRDPAFAREACFDTLYNDYARGAAWQAYPEVPDFLARARARGLQLAVVSNFDRRLHAILRDLGWAPFFDAVILSGEVGASKPSPLIFEAALRALGRTADETIHIGDDPRCDWQGAREAGLGVFELDRKSHTLKAFWDVLEPMITETN